MNKEFVPYELAVKLKELGFDKPCFFAFDNCSHPMRCSDLRTNEQKFDGVNYNSSSYTSQPTFSQAFRWFREEHGHNGVIEGCKKHGFEWCIFPDMEHYIKPPNNFNTYEEAEVACFDKLIDILTKQQEQ